MFLCCFDRLGFSCDLPLPGSSHPSAYSGWGVVVGSIVGDRGRDIRLPVGAVTRGDALGLVACAPAPEAAGLSSGLNFSIWHPCLKAGWSSWILCLCYLHCLPKNLPRGELLGELSYCTARVIRKSGISKASCHKGERTVIPWKCFFLFLNWKCCVCLSKITAVQKFGGKNESPYNQFL